MSIDLPKSTLERALELASSGHHRSLLSIRKTLKYEHYNNIKEDLAGPSIATELKRLIQVAEASVRKN